MGSYLNSESLDLLASPLTHPRPSGFAIYVARLPSAPFASTAFDIRTGHRQRLGSGIISRSGEVAALPFHRACSSTCTRFGSSLTISGERDAPRWLYRKRAHDLENY